MSNSTPAGSKPPPTNEALIFIWASGLSALMFALDHPIAACVFAAWGVFMEALIVGTTKAPKF